MTTPALHLLFQKIFVLGTGRAASNNELQVMEKLVNGGDYTALVDAVNEYMKNLQATTGTEALVRQVALNGFGLQLSPDSAAYYTEAIKNGEIRWSDAFITCLTLPGEYADVLNNKGQAAAEFITALAETQKSELYPSDATSAAVKNFLANISGSEQSLANGLSGLNSLAKNMSSSGIKNSVVDGYVAGATVFIDSDADGILDPDEYQTTTDEGGNYVLPHSAPQVQLSLLVVSTY